MTKPDEAPTAGSAPFERPVGRMVPKRAVIAAKIQQARALHDLVLTLGLRPGSERSANDVSREAAIMDAEIEGLLRELLPRQIPNEFGHMLTPAALWNLYVEDSEPPNGPGELPAPGGSARPGG